MSEVSNPPNHHGEFAGALLTTEEALEVAAWVLDAEHLGTTVYGPGVQPPAEEEPPCA